MTDLPSLNSTTSLSDNVALRNYYDNLLFKNSSGKSLTDLPKKLREETDTAVEPEENNPKLDFINGFRNPSYGTVSEGLFSGVVSASSQNSSSSSSNNNPLSRPMTEDHNSAQLPNSRSELGSLHAQAYSRLMQQPHQQRQIFNLGMGYDTGLEGGISSRSMGQMSFAFQPVPTIVSQSQPQTQMQSRDNSLTSVGPSGGALGMPGFYNTLNQQAVSASSTMSPVTSAGNSILGGYIPLENHGFATTRRSSYISDQLIHGQQQQQQQQAQPQSRQAQQAQSAELSMNQIYEGNFTLNNTINYSGHNVQNLQGQQHLSQRHLQGPQSQQQSQKSQQQSQSKIHNQPQSQPQSQSHSGQRNKTLFPQKHASVPHINFNGGTNYNEGPAGGSKVPSDQQSGTFPLENGLILCNGQIVSSSDLKQLYRNSSGHYFSAKECFEFIDELKDVLRGDESVSVGTVPASRREMILKFVGFLKSCNLNYNPQSDAFVSSNQHRRSSTSSYLHYKPLVLVALKNGKLELLSLPQSTNLNMSREDLVIIDGDRGKDLAMVIEPKVDIDLALFINFLKKKIHFDSLITVVDQHYPNERFIQALMDSTNNGCSKDELNHKLYDVIELTQLIIPSKQVLRFATPWEVSTNLHNKFQDELKALHIAQLKLKSLNNGVASGNGSAGSGTSSASANSNATNDNPGSNGSSRGNSSGSAGNESGSASNMSGPVPNKSSLNIKILNAEFQFDRKKLTFYYVCQERNDFRELIKELFKFYKTRIWLCAIPNNLGIDKKYYDEHKKEWAMYQQMMKHYANDDLVDSNMQGGFIVAPPLYEIELDNFQLGVYKELVSNMFP